MAYTLLLLRTWSAILFLFFFFFSFSLSFTPRFPYSSIKRPKQLFSAAENDKKIDYDTKYFTQVLDHFSFTPQSYQSFQQRYLINGKYWGGGAGINAPIFVYTGNEGDIEWFAQNTGFMFDTAPHFKALLVFIEVC